MRSTLAVVAGGLAQGLAPDPVISPVEWARKNMIVPDGPLQGSPWSDAETPYWREPLECLSSWHEATRVSVRKSAQVGYTTLAMAWLGSIIANAPGPGLVVQPTGDALKNFNREKFQPVIDATPALRKKVIEQTSRSAEGSSTFFKKFPGGFLAMVPATSPAALRAHTVRYVFKDEGDEYPRDLEGQGSPHSMIDARQIAYHATGDYKMLEGSTPTIDGLSNIDDAFMAGDQRYFQLPCPHCDSYQRLVFEQLRFERELPHLARYVCAECGAEIEHHQKRAMLAKGKWVAEASGPGRHPSFHVDTMISPFTTWDHLVTAFLAAEGNPILMKTFNNLWLGLSHKVAGESPEAEILLHRRVDYKRNTLPSGVLFLTFGADVQADRIEVEIVGWGIGQTRWSIDYRVFEGDTAQPGSKAWIALSELMQETWKDWQGNPRRIECGAVDAGFRSQMVYSFTRGRGNVIAVKGMGQVTHPLLGTPSRQDVRPDGKRIGSVLLFPVGTWQAKAELYARLNAALPEGLYPPGWCYFPLDEERYGISHFQQLTSERLVETQKRGYTAREWVKNPSIRNEPLDCAVYARVAATHLGMDRWTAADWERLAADRGAPPAEAQIDLLRHTMAPAPAKRPPTAGGKGRSVTGVGRRVN